MGQDELYQKNLLLQVMDNLMQELTFQHRQVKQLSRVIKILLDFEAEFNQKVNLTQFLISEHSKFQFHFY